MSAAAASLRSNVTGLTRLIPSWAWGLLFLLLGLLWPEICKNFFDLDLLDASIESLGFVIMALGLNIVVGFAGLLDLGYVAFYAIGAFVMGWLGSAHFANADVHVLASEFANRQPGIHLWFPLILIAGALFTGLWGVILGAPTLRLRGDYLAIVTLAFGEIVPRVFENATSGIFGIGSTDFSNGRQGITPVDKVALLPGDTPLRYPLELEPIYYVALAMVIFTIFLNIRLRDSRLGRAWIAVREDEVAAAAMGVNLVRTKLWAYAMGAALGGFAGVFLATYRNTVNVDQFEFGFSVFILAMVILGGMGNISGVILGAVVLSMINKYLLVELNGVPDAVGLDFDVTSISFGIFGFLLVVMMVLRPEGLLPSRRRRLELHGVGTDPGEAIPSTVAGDEEWEVRRK
jgi:branched-chain amino acid transport system permease protein